MKKAPTFRIDEDALQIYAADVLSAFKRPGVLAYHTPNGRKRHIGDAVKLKRMGVMRGVPDWTIIAPHPTVRASFTLAFLELKEAKGKQSSDQIEFEKACNALGVEYRIARTPEEIDAVLTEFGAIDKPSVSQPTERLDASCGPGAANVSGSRPRAYNRSPKADESRLSPQR